MDGSAVVTYADGSMLILESALAKPGVLCEGKPVDYNEPAPPSARASGAGPRKVAIGKK